MKVLFLNPAFGHGFCKSARWFAKSRGRVQRHPDYLCQAIAVLEEAGHECRFIDGAARDLSPEETLASVVADSLLSEFVAVTMTVYGPTSE